MNREQLFKKNTRQNQEFERYLVQTQQNTTYAPGTSWYEPTLLDATQSKYIPLSYFTSTHTHTHTSPETSPATSCSPPRSSRRQLGKADNMPFESFKIINLQKPGKNAHSLILVKSQAITANQANIGIFEPNGQFTQREITIIDHHSISATAADPTTAEQADVSRQYMSVSPKLCINYGTNAYNPGYCGIFGIIFMVFFREFNKSGSGHAKKTPESWLRKWNKMLEFMGQDIPDEPSQHGCRGTKLAARVQEIIAAATPGNHAAFQQAEKEIIKEIKTQK